MRKFATERSVQSLETLGRSLRARKLSKNQGARVHLFTRDFPIYRATKETCKGLGSFETFRDHTTGVKNATP